MLESILNGNLFGSSLLGGPQGQAHGVNNAEQGREDQKSKDMAHLPPPQVGRADFAAAERFSRADDFLLELTTKEGDKVTINFSHASATESSIGATRDANGNAAMSYSVSRAESNNFQFSVEGDLNEEELQSIQKMIEEVGQIANDFFDGDVQEAFEKASEFELDRSQLSSMSLHMSRTEQYSAAAAYQQVQDSSQPPGLGRIGQMAGLLNDQQKNDALSFVDQLGSLQEQILDALVQQDSRYKDADEAEQNKLDQNLNVLHSIVNQ